MGETKMAVRLDRISTSLESTIGALYIEGGFQCWTIEDAWHMVKQDGVTRIPADIYDLKLRTDGGMTGRYAKKFPEMHKGMLWLQNVPAFEWVYLHIGNTAKESLGCPLVGDRPNNNQVADGFVRSSTPAYKRIYPPIADSILSGVPTQIEIRDLG